MRKPMQILKDKESLTILMFENELDGKKVAYHSETEFLVQLGRGKKGSYKTIRTATGHLASAVYWYNSLNIGNGYKKRLIAPSFNKPLLARAWS